MSPASRIWMSRCIRAILMLTLVSLMCVAAASVLRLDQSPLGMLLTYPPRLPIIIFCILLFTILWLRHQRVAAAICLACLPLLLLDLFGWKTVQSPVPDAGNPSLTVLAFNVHEATGSVQELRQMCQHHRVDILMLQEVSPANRPTFVQGLPEFEFVHADEQQIFEYSHHDAFSLLTGVRRSRMVNGQPPKTLTALTGYRTFASQFQLQLSTHVQPIWLVNVHCTKSFYGAKGIVDAVLRAEWKAERHMREFDALNTWQKQQSVPRIMAGDFNAPLNVRNLQFQGLVNAQCAVGSFPHLTFPAKIPLWGIDHTLASPEFHIAEYNTFNAGFSDHCAQVTTLQFRSPPLSSANSKRH